MTIYPTLVLQPETKKHNAIILGSDSDSDALYYGIVCGELNKLLWFKLDQENVEGEEVE